MERIASPFFRAIKSCVFMTSCRICTKSEGRKMIRLRITGIPHEVDAFIEAVSLYFFVANISKSYQNSGSPFVRVYATIDLERKKEDE